MLDLLNKELIASMMYTNFNTCRGAEKTVSINGRTFTSLGTNRASVFVANIYKAYSPSVKSNKYVLFVGESKQCKFDECSGRANVTIFEKEEILIEQAHLNALEKPCIIMEIPESYVKEIEDAISNGTTLDLKIQDVIKSYLEMQDVDLLYSESEYENWVKTHTIKK